MNLTSNNSYSIIALSLVTQLVLVCVITLSFGLSLGKNAAFSAFAGGLIIFLSNLYSARLSFKSKALSWFYVGLLAKWLLMLIMLAVILRKLPELNPAILLVSFTLMAFISGFIPLFFNPDKTVVAR